MYIKMKAATIIIWFLLVEPEDNLATVSREATMR